MSDFEQMLRVLKPSIVEPPANRGQLPQARQDGRIVRRRLR